MIRLVHLSVFLAFFSRVDFCECTLRSFNEYYSSAELIFTGKVVEIKGVGEKDGLTHFDNDITYKTRFVYKGDKVDSIVLRNQFTSCRFGGTLDKEYLIFAYKTQDGLWTTNQCSGSREVKEAKLFLQELNCLTR